MPKQIKQDNQTAAKAEPLTIKDLEKQLFAQRQNICKEMTVSELALADEFCEEYKAFLDAGKTERTAARRIIEKAKAAGFKEFKAGKKYKSGDKLYVNNREKAVILAVIGYEPLDAAGVRIIASHIDSPRIDLKANALFEDNELAYFKTHYYGGIKKYQWAAIPLSLQGVVCKADGSTVQINIGEDESDPVFTITDLLPHLAEAQYKRPAKELIKGEELNVLIGSRPFKSGKEVGLCPTTRSEPSGERSLGAEHGSVKLAIMKLLHDKYGITESDFTTAELELVPAFKARDVGFDRSLVGAYGQDDRVCAYTSLTAMLDLDGVPAATAVCVFADKEEVGSYGNTGLGSNYLEYFLEDLADAQGVNVRRIFEKSKCLSADVCAALDPTFADVSEKNNSAFMNRGAVIQKYVGSRGKSGTNDASAEYLAELRGVLDGAGVPWQTGELGKVDAGGGGTVAMFVARMNIDTVDIGVPVLSMHAPMELTAKADVYAAYRGFGAFWRA
ncbi:MAG: aminopeptidase [Oscillospiraceae bacterium]|nr:aminopeptidase [Oscillospiraceae bacterium]